MSRRYVKNAVVVDYQKRRKPSKHYVYVINVTWSDSSVVVIFRRYSHFFDLQTKLFEQFPEESGVKDPSLRSLPFLPGKIIFGRSNIRDVAEKRKKPINDYCQSLIKLARKISQSDLVVGFFEPTNDDISALEHESKPQKDKLNVKEERAKVISEPIQLDQYIVIADYHKQNRSEVSVLAGDIVEVIEKNENGWWFVNMDEEQGWLPASYLEPEDGSVEKSVTVVFKPGEERYIASRAYTANEPDEMGFQKGVVVDVLEKNIDGWWLIRYNGSEGWAPSLYLKKFDPNQPLPIRHAYENITLSNEPAVLNRPQRPPKPVVEGTQSNKPPPRKASVKKSHKVKNRVRSPPTSPEAHDSTSSLNEAIYVAMSDYRAQGGKGVLSVEKGSSVDIIEKSPNGWWYCRKDGKEGWLPSSYIERRDKKTHAVEEKKPEIRKPQGPKPIPRPVPAIRTAIPKPVVNGFDYVAIGDFSDDDQLNISLKKGELVKVLEKTPSGWWYVQCNGSKGWAPSTYLKEKTKVGPTPRRTPPRPSPPDRPKNTSSGHRINPGPPIPNRSRKPTLPRYINSSSAENLLSLKPTAVLNKATARSTENLSAQPKIVQYYHVIADYTDGTDDTLDIKKGDKIEVIRKDEGGWWLAKIGNRSGWVPSNYLEK